MIKTIIHFCQDPDNKYLYELILIISSITSHRDLAEAQTDLRKKKFIIDILEPDTAMPTFKGDNLDCWNKVGELVDEGWIFENWSKIKVSGEKE